MSLTSIEAAVRGALDNAEKGVAAEYEKVRPRLEELTAWAQKADESPLVAAALAAVLPANVEQSLAELITVAHNEFAKVPASTVTVQPAPAGGQGSANAVAPDAPAS
jgi:hypothetical protein